MEVRIPEWESELWSYVSSGDGANCPLYHKCHVRREGGCYISDSNKDIQNICRLIDADTDADEAEAEAALSPAWGGIGCFRCDRPGRIFQLATMLARKYLEKAKVHSPPVPTSIISVADDNRPIEVHQVPLKAYRGAIWRLNDRWVIQLRSADTLARQRFTLYHELFHVLAHCRGTPVFRKIGTHDGSFNFNELLADNFASNVLLPSDWVKRKWPKVKDLNRMAEIFAVPRPVMFLTLRLLHLI